MDTFFLTGGSGSLGSYFSQYLYREGEKNITIYSRNEYLQYKLKQKLLGCNFILGDIRSYNRLIDSIPQGSIVVHMAAIKHVSASYENPYETIDINVNGTINVIRACKEKNVKKCVFISTDKAVNPINLYGSTKMIGEDLFLNEDERFKIVRGGNLMGSSGSVLPYYLELIKQGKKKLPLSHMDCKRYWMEFRDMSRLIMYSIDYDEQIVTRAGDEFYIHDLILALGCNPELMGLRPGEKLSEQMNRFPWEFKEDGNFLEISDIQKRIERLKNEGIIGG